MRRAAWLALAATVLQGCGEESPTDVGGPLLPAEAIRTFEVVLDAADYLEADTSFAGYTTVQGAGFQVIANGFEGVLGAHTLARFEIPLVIAVTDTAGVVRSDSTPVYVGGRVVARIDTLRSNLPAVAEFRLTRIEEEWDPGSATWTWRVDSSGVRLAWAQEGALGGAPIASLDWTPEGTDSLVIPVDSQTIAAWSDTTTGARGAVLWLATAGARVRVVDLVLRVDARSELNPDTLFTTTIRPPDPTFVFDPPLPDRSSDLIVSGVPGWRTFFRFRSDLGGRTVPCPTTPGCRIRLDQTSITRATLVLEPEESPAGYLPQDSLLFDARVVYVSNGVPLARSPLGVSIGTTTRQVEPGRFRNVVGAEPVEMPITGFVAALVSADTTLAPPSPWVALLPYLEGVDFGVATFRPSPRLRLVLTIASELHLR